MSNLLTIHKQVEKKKFEESPQGKLEREISKFYDEMKLANKKMPEDLAEQVYNIRDEQEKWALDYIERTNQEHKKAMDDKLFESMTKELEIINKFKSTATNE